MPHNSHAIIMRKMNGIIKLLFSFFQESHDYAEKSHSDYKNTKVVVFGFIFGDDFLLGCHEYCKGAKEEPSDNEE